MLPARNSWTRFFRWTLPSGNISRASRTCCSFTVRSSEGLVQPLGWTAPPAALNSCNSPSMVAWNLRYRRQGVADVGHGYNIEGLPHSQGVVVLREEAGLRPGQGISDDVLPSAWARSARSRSARTAARMRLCRPRGGVWGGGTEG